MDVTATEFLKQATNTAEHFGFRSLDVVKKHPSCKNCTNKIENASSAVDRRTDNLYGLLTCGLSDFCEAKLQDIEEPILFYNSTVVPRTGETAISFQIFNVPNSIAEAILIQATHALTNDLGFQNHCVRINSLGDRDSSVRYIRELTNYMKKRINDLPDTALELMKEHALSALMHLIEKEHELAYKTPSPLEYLTDQSRKHFREIIEYLDMAQTQYEIDPKLIGHHECYNDALFAIDMLDDDGLVDPTAPLFIRGGRYNQFVYKNTKKQISAAGAVVVLKDKKAPARSPRVKLKTPTVYVVQLGFGPKIKSLILIDELRQAGINVMQNLASDSLSAQLRDAEAKGVKYVVIIGQKEYVDGNVILRDMEARNQEHVSVASLAGRLKRSPVVTVV